jgi:fermentation-respiration switch protein FrsA (DUF1100 family)
LLAAIVLAAFALIWSLQRRLIYFPSAVVPRPETLGLRDVEQITFPTSDGLTLNGWFLSTPAPSRFTVLVFNGNAGNRAHRAAFADALRPFGLNVFLFDYRGYGGNAGSPTETGLRLDARAARSYLLTRADVEAARLVYFGESLGTAVASELAVAHPPAALILRSPFSSAIALGQHHYPSVPVRWMLRDTFETKERISRIHTPLLVIAGDRDSIVPIAESRQVFEAASEPKSLLVVAGADHNDQELFTGKLMIDAMIRFLHNLGYADTGLHG